MIWDVGQVRLLRKYWRLGLSTSAIGHYLGCSKNAVVGKAHRLDLPARPAALHDGHGNRVVRIATAGGRSQFIIQSLGK